MGILMGWEQKFLSQQRIWLENSNQQHNEKKEPKMILHLGRKL